MSLNTENINFILKNKKAVLRSLYLKYPPQEVEEALSRVMFKVVESNLFVKSSSFWVLSVKRLLFNYKRDMKRWHLLPKGYDDKVSLVSEASYEEKILKNHNNSMFLEALCLLPEKQKRAIQYYIANGTHSEIGNYDTNKANFRHGMTNIKKIIDKEVGL